MTKEILVTGDFVLDNHIYKGQRFHYGEAINKGVHLVPQLGGAALVHQILEELLRPKPKQEKKEGNAKENFESILKSQEEPAIKIQELLKIIEEQEKPLPRLEPEWMSFPGVKDPIQDQKTLKISPAEQAYAFWRPYADSQDTKSLYWRVSEAMGFGAAEIEAKCGVMSPVSTSNNPKIVVISEGGMGFRKCRSNWPEKAFSEADWIVLKTTAPLADGPLWKELTEKHGKKLIIIVSARELRKSSARMNAGLSWEETVEGFFRELQAKGAFSVLTQCSQLIVAFESEGALWLNLQGKDRETRVEVAAAKACLVYESGLIEGEHGHTIKGRAFGLLSCLAAAVTWALTQDLTAPDIVGALEGGLGAMRDLRDKGHGKVDYQPPIGFPAGRLAGVIKKTTLCYARAWFLPKELRMLTGNGPVPEWSLLNMAQGYSGPVYDLARLVLLRGPIALESLPYLKIGNLLTADRREIESLRTLVQVIRRYEDKKNAGKKPLSIGVFGPPGAGKSFAVRELAKALEEDIAWLEFNLSQFDTPEDLNGAFHQIRDQVLKHKLPIAFFDEFDSQKYRWLQYLLAPMQDGQFQDGQLTHTLGKCIFVFAGGTSPTFETFGPAESMDKGKESDDRREFRFAKGPDFKSRLDAYLDVLGPNQRQIPVPSGNKYALLKERISGRDFITDPADIVFPLRRALIARAQLKYGPDDKLDMDEGLVHALLHVKKFTHGNRSLEKILQPLGAGRPGKLHRSLLMPVVQLAMHTDAKEFITLCAKAPKPFLPQSPLTIAQIDQMAPAIHEAYRQKGKKEGWSKPETDCDYTCLSEFFKNSNRAAAERMLRLLGLAGLTMVKDQASPLEEETIRQHLEYYLLGLAEAEHEGWMDWFFDQGWQFNPERQDDKKLHDCLIRFSKLNDKNKAKDRDSIRLYPEFAREAKMKIVFIQEQH